MQERKQDGKPVRDSKIVAITLLEKDSYQHSKYGPTAIPVLNAIEFMPLNGPAPAAPVEPTPPTGSTPGSATADQPRRRRVA
jgi:hypothetical protein